MGDFSAVLPLTGSPLHNGSPLRYIATVYYDKAWKTLKPVISISKKIKVPAVFGGPVVGPLLENDSELWYLFSVIPCSCMMAAVINFVDDPGFFIGASCVAFLISHLIGVYSVVYWYRDMPFQLIGAKAKFMIDTIPMIIAAALHHLLEFNYGYLALELGCCTYFYFFTHFMHITYDIGVIDVFLGIAMQVLAYMLNVDLLTRALVLSFLFGLCFYRYMTYCAPELPAHRKKELEQLPC